MKKIIAVDVDDVVADLVNEWLRKYNEDHHDSLKEDDILTWDIASYTKIGSKIYEYLKRRDLYDNVVPILGASWGIEKLREFGFRVIFVTNSTPEHSGVKYEWLKKYKMISSRDDYVEAADKSLILSNYLIDDNPKNIINFKGQGTVFTKSWNKSLRGYLRFPDWCGVINYFLLFAPVLTNFY